MDLKGVNLDRMSQVKINENESFEIALKRFNRRVQQDGILAEARRREHFEKPSVKRQRKEAARRHKTTMSKG
jgi:small subunit ribosomal protein S21